MDLLASLGLSNDLPEQSTREIPGIIKAMDGDDVDVDDGVRLGFNRCLHCGVKLSCDEATATNPGDGAQPSMTTATELIDEKNRETTSCRGCDRVSYCSNLCLKADASPSDKDDEVGCWGHSPVVCSLLGLCDDDEAAEEEILHVGKRGGEYVNNDGKGGNRSKIRRDAARYRVQTERESYPATLFNVLSEGPDWFVEAITQRLRRNQNVRSPQPTSKTTEKRRGKRDRSSAFGRSNEKDGEGDGELHRRGREIVLHVVGASAESELWGWDGKDRGGIRRNNDRDDDEEEGESVHVLDAFAEASANLATYLENFLQVRSISIRCIFVGPDCPLRNYVGSLPIPYSKSSTLSVETYRRNYGDDAGQPGDRLPAPDAIVFFNPGFTCPDYDWSTALSASTSWPTAPTPFLVATNTEIEGYADVKYLLDGGHVDPSSLPVDVLEAMDVSAPYGVHRRCPHDDDDDDYSGETFLFHMNPYAGLRVRQSGTMGNDLYVKNRWIVCGLFRSGRRILDGGGLKIAKDQSGGKSTVDGDDEDDGEVRSRKRRRDDKSRPDEPHGEKNVKRSNPALI